MSVARVFGPRSFVPVAFLGIVAIAGLWPGPLRAAVPDRRLAERLDPKTANAVADQVENARAAGLPAEPLIAIALEGASKGARGDRIVAVVSAHAAALREARQRLGAESTPAELTAGAAALMSGVPPDTLSRLRAARPRGSLVVPLVVLADWVTRRVPIATASAAVLHASRLGARDSDLLRLRAQVESDIRRGTSPSAAVIARARSLGAGPTDATQPPTSRGEWP